MGHDSPAIHRIGLSETPEGANSAYVLPDRGVVVDPGPPIDDAWDRLVAGIESVTAVEEVDHILVTHWHIDHAGLAPRLAETADATLHLHHEDAPLVGNYTVARDARVARDSDHLLAWGVPESLVESLAEGDTPSPMPETFPVEQLRDGDDVAGIECLHTPGHTAGHAAFLVPGGAGDGPVPLVGDLLLPGTTPNVGGGDTRLESPLATYLDSLDRLERRTDDATAHPGHGEAFRLAPRAELLRRHHAERVDDCVAVVAGFGEATPWQVAESLFGEMAGIHAKMGAGEAASHLAAAASSGRLSRVGDDPVRYTRE